MRQSFTPRSWGNTLDNLGKTDRLRTPLRDDRVNAILFTILFNLPTLKCQSPTAREGRNEREPTDFSGDPAPLEGERRSRAGVKKGGGEFPRKV